MTMRFDDELARFHEFIGQCLAANARAISPEEALDLWRAEHSGPQDFEETVDALKDALADLHAGDDGQPFDEFIRSLLGKEIAKRVQALDSGTIAAIGWPEARRLILGRDHGASEDL